MTEEQIVAKWSFEHEATGCRVLVIQVPEGFAVVLQDIATGETAPEEKVFPAFAQAAKHARLCQIRLMYAAEEIERHEAAERARGQGRTLVFLPTNHE